MADLQNINDYLKERHPRYRDPTMRKLYGVTASALVSSLA